MKLTKSKLQQIIKEELERALGDSFDFIEYIKEWVEKKNREGRDEVSWGEILEWNTDYAGPLRTPGLEEIGTITDAEARRDSRLNYLNIYRKDGALIYTIDGSAFSPDEHKGAAPTNAEDAEQFLEKYVWSQAEH